MKFILKLLAWLVVAGIVVLVVMQLIPINRTNPPVTRAVNWDSPQTQELAKRACYDCHSNETVWPWYANVAPVKFLLANHVQEGREKMNFSQWDQPQGEVDEAQEAIEKGEMPTWDYLLMHSEAKLTAAEKQQLIDGLNATFAQDPPIEREGRGEGDD